MNVLKKEIKNESNLLAELEDQNLFEDSILGNEITCGRETTFDDFIEKLNYEIANDVAVESRWHNVKLHSSKWISIRHMLEDVSLLMGLDDHIPSLGWIEAQFTSNHCRALINERHCGRINIIRNTQ